MRLVLTIIIAVLSVGGFAQTGKTANIPWEAYRNVKELRAIDSISAREIVGEIPLRFGGLTGWILRLDRDMNYRLISYDCFGRKVTDSGRWSIAFKRMLRLESQKGFQLFDIIEYGKFYFYIEPKDRMIFIQMLNKVREQRRSSHLTARYLNTEYFGREIKQSK
jgi:hypothetical protein